MSELVRDQTAFYREKYDRYGDDPRSLSYNTEKSQRLRFAVLAELFRHENKEGSFSVHEAGCGLAHMQEFLLERQYACQYSGCDIVPEFVAVAKRKYPERDFVVQDIAAPLTTMKAEVRGHDYYVVSGTFNPIGNTREEDWRKFVFAAVGNMFAMCRKGVGFNMLTSYSDFRTDGLYYFDPCDVYDWCKKNLSRFVTVVSDCPLYEFTVLVYRKEFVRALHQDAEYDRYFIR